MSNNDKKQKLYRKILSKYSLLYEPVNDIKCDTGNFANAVILAPVINLFVMWLLQQAEEKNIKRLFFIARDGYPLYIVAKKYCELCKIDIECKYLFCSRYKRSKTLFLCKYKRSI